MTAGGIEQDAYASEETSLREYWALARRRKWYIIVPVLFALGYSLATSMSTTPMYQAKADVLVQAAPVPGAVSSETSMTTRTLNNELLRAQGTALEAEARQKVGEEPTLSVSLAQDKDADLFVFAAQSRSAERAAAAANAYADTYVASRQADLAADFQSQAEVLQQQLDAAEDRLAESSEGAGAEELRVIIAGYRSDIDEVQTAAKLAAESGASVVNVASAPNGPFSPQPVRSAILALLLGLFVGIAAALLRDYTDNHIRTPEALEKATGLPTSAVVPKLKSWKKTETHVVILEDSSSPQAEAYRSLRARIQFRRVDRQIRSLMVTSARPGEGKTTTSSNLAVAFAAAGENTVLVDLDMRRPRIHKFFGLDNDHGMSTVLLGADLESAIRPLTSVPNLSIVPAGPSTGEASEILHDDSLHEVLGALKARFDIVIIDTPPVLAVADPLTISHFCDGSLLVVSASGTDKRDAELASGQLAGVQAPMIGAVLNNYSAAETGYSYSYAYSDYSPTNASSAASKPVTTASELPAWSVDRDSSADEIPGPPKLSRRQKRKLEREGVLGDDPQLSSDQVPRDFGYEDSATYSSSDLEVAPESQLEVEIGSNGSNVALTAPTYLNEVEPADWSEDPLVSGGENRVDDGTGQLPIQGAGEPGWVPQNGNAPDLAFDAAASASESMSSMEVQRYLRAELRQARLEHAANVDVEIPAEPGAAMIVAGSEPPVAPDSFGRNASERPTPEAGGD